MTKIERIANAISYAFYPLLIPTYGLLAALNLSTYAALPWLMKLRVITVFFVFTALLPFLLIVSMKSLGFIKSINIPDKSARTIPFIATVCLFIVGTFYLYIAQASWWLLAFMVGGILALAIVAAINVRWKISAHSAGMGALLALMVGLYMRSGNPTEVFPWLIATLIATGIVMTSRLILQCHTQGQVWAGCACGFICVIVMSII